MKNSPFLIIILFLVLSCTEKPVQETSVLSKSAPILEQRKSYQIFFDQNPEFHSNGFDFPVGIPDAKGYYNALPYGENNHLGDDWNAVTGGNTDLGDPIYAISNGYVNGLGHEGPGWGNVIRIIHYNEKLKPPYVESIYAHCESVIVKTGQGIKKGEIIGTIGNADGAYSAHLHLEIRDSIEWPIGGGYSPDSTGYLNPTRFIRANRGPIK